MDDCQNPADAYLREVKQLALSRLTLVLPPGTLEIDATSKRFVASQIAAELLELKHGHGRLADLDHVFHQDDAIESKPNRLIVFKNGKDQYVRVRALEDGGLAQRFIVEDVTPVAKKEFEFADQGRDIRGLFEKAPYGIYRSTVDGKPLRCNPAMVAMNGYATEEELFAVMKDTSKQWYVDPNQRARFLETLHRDGMVLDLVSEVNLHNTGTTMWVSETAWLFDDPELGLKVIEGTAIDVTARMAQQKALEDAASSDWLTGLGNRSAFHAYVADRLAMMPKGGTLAVMLIDLDRFKDVNDVFGHARGDLLLKHVSRRMMGLAPAQGFLARLGGDEFGLAVPCGSAEALTLAAEILRTIALPYRLEGSEHTIGGSLGLATYPNDAATAMDLMKAADMALYKSKHVGRGEAEVFDAALAKEKTRQAELIHDLRGADQRGELELHYQPIVNASSGRIVGFEALMRWRHPKRGLVPPMEFIPIAEEAGLMVGFGNWAINQACMEAAALPEHMHMAVNVSAVQFYSTDLVHVVAEALARHKVSASRLELEVTESFLLINEALTRQILMSLKDLGVSIALDDFGTGYSSLSYLQRFQFNKVKIDKSFVRGMKSNVVNSAIVRAVLAIGRDLGLAVVAEGIETETEKNELLAEGCPFFQGFLYGKPRPIMDVTADLNVAMLREQQDAHGVDQAMLRQAR